MAGKKNRDRTEKTVCRKNGKAMEMVIEIEAAQEENQQIPENEPADADKKKAGGKRSRITGGFFETDEGASWRGVSGIS